MKRKDKISNLNMKNYGMRKTRTILKRVKKKEKETQNVGQIKSNIFKWRNIPQYFSN